MTLSDVILIGEPTESAALLSDSHTLVYSRFSIKILEILKKKIDAHVGSQFNAVKLGGSIRFPSGHVATFLFPGYGFPGLGRRYFFFLIKAHGTETFMVSSLFSIEGELVFPVNEVTKARYSRGLPLNEFNAHLRAAIRENVDVTDGRDVEP